MRTTIIRTSLLVGLLGIAGCGASAGISVIPNWKESGSIVLSRVAPAVPTVEERSAELLGFLPGGTRHHANWIRVDRSANTLSLMSGDLSLAPFEARGLEKLNPGNFVIVHKQTQPLWHAGDAYFTARGLPVPPEGSRERYRKGALGSAVLYLDQDTPIYSSPIHSEEVGGVQLSAGDLKKLFDSVEVGAAIEVK